MQCLHEVRQAKTKLEFAKKLIGTLSYAFLKQGDAVGLNLLLSKQTEDIPARRNPSQLQDILSILVMLKRVGKIKSSTNFTKLQNLLKAGAQLIIYSDFLDDPKSIADVIHHMRDRKHEVIFFHIMDRQEVEFTFDRPTRFIDLEGGSSILTEPSIIRDEYLKQMRKHFGGNQKNMC